MAGIPNSKVEAMAVDVRHDAFKSPFHQGHDSLPCVELLRLANMAKYDMIKEQRDDPDYMRVLYERFQRKCDDVIIQIQNYKQDENVCVEMLAHEKQIPELSALTLNVWKCGVDAVDIEILRVLWRSQNKVAIFYGGVQHCINIAKYLKEGALGGWRYNPVVRERKERRYSI